MDYNHETYEFIMTYEYEDVHITYQETNWLGAAYLKRFILSRPAASRNCSVSLLIIKGSP